MREERYRVSKNVYLNRFISKFLFLTFLGQFVRKFLATEEKKGKTLVEETSVYDGLVSESRLNVSLGERN